MKLFLEVLFKGIKLCKIMFRQSLSFKGVLSQNVYGLNVIIISTSTYLFQVINDSLVMSVGGI